jgi:hypothetical protein
VSTLRSALDELQAEDLGWLADEQLEEDFGELQRASQVLEAERLRRLAEVQRRASFERNGYLSATSWLADRFRMAWSYASGQVRMARALAEMPVARAALAAGELSASSLPLLVAAREIDPAVFADHERILVDAARTLSVVELKYAIWYWRQAIDREGALKEAERLRERRRLHASQTLDGMVRLDGDLDPETGETVLTALRAAVDATWRRERDDDRSLAQMRADALGEICRRWLDSADRPQVAGERPHVSVTVALDTLQGRLPGLGEFELTGPVAPALARRLACDASVSRFITLGPSEPLDVGRRTSVVPAALRRAVVHRDRACRFPGCGRPHAWCDAHHIVHWSEGGATTRLANLMLLCRPHHRLVHEGGFGLEILEGRATFRRPDGSILEERAPP